MTGAFVGSSGRAGFAGLGSAAGSLAGGSLGGSLAGGGVDDFDSGDVTPAGTRGRANRALPRGARERWKMSMEAVSLTAVTAIIVVFGLAVLFSASAVAALSAGQPSYYFLVRQATGVAAGIVLFAVTAKLDVDWWRRLAWPLMLLSLLLMLVIILPFTESIAPSLRGSRRYLYGASLQPSEFAKFAVTVWTAMLLVKKGSAVKRLGKGVLPFVLVIGTLSLLAILEPDLSIAMMFCLLMAVLLFVGGARVAHFIFLGVLLVPLVFQNARAFGYVQKRLDSFWADEATDRTKETAISHQQRQSLLAVGSGQKVGVGFGQGVQQRGWLPLAYNDFIGSVIGEEFGFVGLAGITLAFALYGWLGFRIARDARTPFATIVAVGLTFTTVLTAFIHLAVVVGLLPNTGLTLPFVSFGRSNLVLTLAMTGILVNIGSTRELVYGTTATDPFETRVS